MCERDLEHRQSGAVFLVTPRVQCELHLGHDSRQTVREWQVRRRAEERGDGECKKLRCATSEELSQQIYL